MVPGGSGRCPLQFWPILCDVPPGPLEPELGPVVKQMSKQASTHKSAGMSSATTADSSAAASCTPGTNTENASVRMAMLKLDAMFCWLSRTPFDDGWLIFIFSNWTNKQGPCSFSGWPLWGAWSEWDKHRPGNIWTIFHPSHGHFNANYAFFKSKDPAKDHWTWTRKSDLAPFCLPRSKATVPMNATFDTSSWPSTNERMTLSFVVCPIKHWSVPASLALRWHSTWPMVSVMVTQSRCSPRFLESTKKSDDLEQTI